MNIQFNNAYLAVKAEMIRDHINRTPKLYRQVHGNRVVIKYRKNGKVHEMGRVSPSFKEAEALYYKTKGLKLKLKRLNAIIKGNFNYEVRTDIKNSFDRAFYESLNSNISNEDGKHPYRHKEFYMRSRFELAMAGVLDELELDYKYEPGVMIGGYLMSPDFVVYLPEFDCCLIIECEGMTDNVSYINSNSVKIAEYLYAGLELGKTLIILQGQKDHMPSTVDMRNAVISAINLISAFYIN